MKQANRRAFLRRMGMVVGGTLSMELPIVAGKSAYASDTDRDTKRASNKPNVLLLYSDQHRFDCLGVAGHPDISTPNIDAITADGVWYPNSFCCSNVCTPSRYSLLTGLYVHQHGGRGNRSTLPPGHATFPNILREHGYNTAAVGKMHFTPTYLDVGFSSMKLAEQDGTGRYIDDYHAWLMENDLVDSRDTIEQVWAHRQRAPADYWESFGAQVSELDEEHHSTTWIGDRALENISGWGADSANLLMVGFIKPHHPFDPPANWADMYDPAAIELPAGWTTDPFERDLDGSSGFFSVDQLTEEKFRKILAYYYALISQIDYQVGRIVALLKKKGLYDNTMIIYTSDHGEYLGYHHLLLKDGPLYDPVVRVPLAIKFDKGVRAGQTHKGQVNALDVTASILAAASAIYPVEPLMPVTLPGFDLADPKAHHEVIYAERWEANQRNVMSGEFAKVLENGGGLTSFMARTQEYKLLLDRQSERTQFFDLRSDPHEMVNLRDDDRYRHRIDRLRDQVFDWLTFANPTPMYTDSKARQISGIHELRLENGHVDRAKDYFYQKIRNQLVQ